MSVSRNDFVCLKVIGKQFATGTVVNGVKWAFCGSCFCFSQLGFSILRANRFRFKGWNCRATVAALNFTRFTTLYTISNSFRFKTETIRSQNGESKLTKTRTGSVKSSLYSIYYGPRGKLYANLRQTKSFLETDIFKYQFYRPCLPRNDRSPGVVTPIFRS
jgi:hypothetical protein